MPGTVTIRLQIGTIQSMKKIYWVLVTGVFGLLNSVMKLTKEFMIVKKRLLENLGRLGLLNCQREKISLKLSQEY